MSSDEGSNGNKRKAEEDKKRNAKKRKHTQTHVYAPSTSSEARQNEQAQEDENWIKCIRTHHEDRPKCKECDEDELCIEINPRPFVKHYKESHPGVRTRKTMSWIFTHFDFVKHKQHLKCKQCDNIVKVSFQGPLKDHILTNHEEKAAKQDGESSQRSHKDAETTAELIQFLYTEDCFSYIKRLPELDAKFREYQDKTKRRLWFIKHWDIHKGNYQEKKKKCLICLKDKIKKSFSMSLHTSDYKRHIISCLNQKKQSLSKKWFTEYFLFRSNVMWCIKCRKPQNLYMTVYNKNNLIRHLRDEHNKEGDGELLPDDSNLNRLVSRFINHLIDKSED